jgi:hypothetical protein
MSKNTASAGRGQTKLVCGEDVTEMRTPIQNQMKRKKQRP